MNKNIITAAIISLLIGGGAGYWFASEKTSDTVNQQSDSSEPKPLFYRNPMNPAITSPVPAQDEMGMEYIPVYAEEESSKERKPLFYRNPMNPAITSPVPAQDEMGMEYIPVYPDNSNTEEPAGTVKIDPTVVQNIGVRAAIAKRSTLSRNIRTIGRVTYDEQRVARLHPKYDGWIEKLFVNRTGDRVRKGDMLLSIYSPQLVASQEEYLLALDNAETLRNSPFEDVRKGAESLLKSSEQRLKLFDMPAHQITQLKTKREIAKGVHIHSPFDGIVMNIGAREGQHLTPQTELYMIADLSKVWVLVDFYEDDMPWVSVGDQAKLRVAGIPGRVFSGTLTHIYPYLEAKTRTVKARLEFDNADSALKPEMFANVEVFANRQIDAVTIPAEAIVRTGTQEQVFIQRALGQFEPREVVVGVSESGKIQIISGLDEGEIVVTSSQFLIDSESKLKEATAKMLDAMKQQDSVDTQQHVAPSHDHGDMNMSEQPDMQDMHHNMDMNSDASSDAMPTHDMQQETASMKMDHSDHSNMDMPEQSDMHQHHDMGDGMNMGDHQ
jgi:Cu(I)/Ag(I) efflux system membrane fusion protein